MMKNQALLSKLTEGNRQFLGAASPIGDVSPAVRMETAENGQKPYAIVLACSDSRVMPETITSSAASSTRRGIWTAG